MDNERINTRYIVGTAFLCALSVIFTLLSDYIIIGGNSLNLAVVVIAVAAVTYGPWSALLVGLFNAGFIFLSPATSAYTSISLVGTIVTVTLKSGLAGLIPGFIYKLFKKHKTVGAIVSSLLVPVLNTTIFIIGAMIFFGELFGNLISLFVTINFIIEFALCVVLCPAIVKILSIINKHNE